MATFTLTRKAKADLKAIAVYTQQQWGKAQRRLYIKQFDDTFHRLANNQEIGKQCDFIKPGYRKFLCTIHIIFYRNTSPSEIEIVRILHKRMDVQEHLK